MRPRQLSFLPRISLEHGGNHRKGRRKLTRPFDPQRPMHVTLYSSRARGSLSMLHSKNRARVDRRHRELATKWGVRVYRYVNVGNHLHLLIRARKRADFQGFLRELAGSVAMQVTGACKGKSSSGFWDGLAWSRIVHWGRDFKELGAYFAKNLFEGEGLFGRREKASGMRVVAIGKDGALRAIGKPATPLPSHGAR